MGEGRDRTPAESARRVHRRSRPVARAVPDADLPAVYGCADVFAMLCRNRWVGLEQEGFGIVFLEAAACGVPQVAGFSGGADEAVVDGDTGLVVDHPADATRRRSPRSRRCSTTRGRRAMGGPARAGPRTSSRTTGWPSELPRARASP